MAGENNIVVADARSTAAVEFLARSVEDIPGAIGPLPWIEDFVAARPEPACQTMRQGIFALDEVDSVPEARGESGPATAAERETITAWAMAFQKEVLGDHRRDDDNLQLSISSRIATQTPELAIWVHTVDGHPVAMSGHSGPTPSGIRISAVFTPPEHSEHRYGTTLVARHTLWLLTKSHLYCLLHTDLANPTSNAIYRKDRLQPGCGIA